MGETRTKTVEPAELFPSYEAAIAASSVALEQARQIEPTIRGALTIQTPEQAAWVGKAGAAIANTRRELEKQRKSATATLYAAYKQAYNAFGTSISLLSQLEDLLAAAMKNYHAALATQQSKALAAIAPTATPTEIARTIDATTPDVEDVSLRQHWVAVGADGKPLPTTPLEAAARGLAIPAEYWVLDASRLHALARKEKSAMNVTGVKALDDKSVVFG